MTHFRRSGLLVVALLAAAGCTTQEPRPGTTTAAAPRPDLSGMWSDPPTTAVDVFCFMTCTEMGVAHLNTLLDEPANDNRPFAELIGEAERYQADAYIRPRLTPQALKTFPLDPADDPGFLRCEPWGFARQIFAPHQFEIQQYDDRVEFRYGEWEGRRTIHLDGRTPPNDAGANPMGFSVGRYEGDSLVVETTGVTPNITFWFAHTDQLRATERYTRSDDGSRLELHVAMEDPVSLLEPIQTRKAWASAPTEKIFPYTGCEPATEFRRRGDTR